MPRKLVTICVLSLCLAESSGLEDNIEDSILLGTLQEMSIQSINHPKNEVRRTSTEDKTGSNDDNGLAEDVDASANNQVDSEPEKRLKDALELSHPTASSSGKLYEVLGGLKTDNTKLKDNNERDSMLLSKLQEMSNQFRQHGIDNSKNKIRKTLSKGKTSNEESKGLEEDLETSANSQVDFGSEERLKEVSKIFHSTYSSSGELHEVLGGGLNTINTGYRPGERLSEFLKAALEFKNERTKLREESNSVHHLKDDDNHHQNLEIDFKSPAELNKKDLIKNGLDPHTTNQEETKGIVVLENKEMSTEYGEYYEGDMIIDKATARSGVLHTSYWANGVVPFDFDNQFPQEDRKKVLKAINYLNHITCLHFRKHWYFLDGPNHVKITNSKPGCFATVGRPNKGAGKVNLGPSCMKKEGIIIHELLHSIGLFHEHSRHDRDEYVKIHWENIKPNDQHNFLMRNNFQVAAIPYDYYSIMHYSTHAYTKNGQPTLEPKKSVDVRMMGQRDFLTKWDLAKVKSLYCR